MRFWRRRTTAPAAPAAPRFEDSVPPALSLEERVRMATLCGDCDTLPKVPGAGEVSTEADGERVQRMHNGLKVVADGYLGEWMTRLIGLCRGHHEPQEERVFHEIDRRLADDATMIELGGWWTYYTLWFLQHHPARRGWVIEPDPRHRAVGEANARRNGLAPVFIPGFAGAAAAPPMPFATESGEQVVIPRLAVPQLMQEAGLDRLDLLHCDAQGAEWPVLQSCADLFRAHRIRFIVVSTHHWTISGDVLTHQRCLDLVLRCGGRIVAEHDVHESFSGDGLIAACFGGESVDWAPVPISRNRYSTSLFRNPLYDLAAARR